MRYYKIEVRTIGDVIYYVIECDTKYDVSKFFQLKFSDIENYNEYWIESIEEIKMIRYKAVRIS